MKYATWEVGEHEARRVMPDGTEVAIKLARWNGFLAGWWPERPERLPDIVLTGICLFDGRWVIEFAPVDRRNPGARRQLALPKRRNEALEFLARGRRPVAVHIPKGMGIYHERLLKFQKLAVGFLSPREVVYHLPVKEYEKYISELNLDQKVTYRQVELLHELADQIRVATSGWQVPIRFVTGLHEDPEESFVGLYLQGYSYPKAVGVEDLVELRLGYEAWRRMGGDPIPVFCAVLDVPHPYLSTDGSTERVEL